VRSSYSIPIDLSLLLRLSFVRPQILILATSAQWVVVISLWMGFTVITFFTHVQGLRFLLISTSLYTDAVPNGNKRNELSYIVHVQLHLIHRHGLRFLHYSDLLPEGVSVGSVSFVLKL